jgi:hypothetical protein
MGLGEILMEEMTYRDKTRNLVHHHPSMLEYKSPTTFEMCDVETYLILEKDPRGPFGAKEVGQGPLLPVMPAVANAVYDAVGVRIDEVPCSPSKVLKALKDKMKGKEGRFGPDRVPVYAFPQAARVLTPAQGGTGREEDERPHSEVGGPVGGKGDAVEQAGETTAAEIAGLNTEKMSAAGKKPRKAAEGRGKE